MAILTRCGSTYDYGETPCKGYYNTEGILCGVHCGEPCPFAMKKGGSGSPPFEIREILFVGGKPFPIPPSGVFRDHNCYRCKDGVEPCVRRGNPRMCEYLHARND